MERRGAAALELELDFRGAGGQRLLPAAPGSENGSEAVASRRESRAQTALRWFTTVVLCAAFLGLVRAGLKPPQAEAGTGVLQGTWSPLVPCAVREPWVYWSIRLDLSFVVWENGHS